jgi:hypothetical protein
MSPRRTLSGEGMPSAAVRSSTKVAANAKEGRKEGKERKGKEREGKGRKGRKAGRKEMKEGRK